MTTTGSMQLHSLVTAMEYILIESNWTTYVLYHIDSRYFLTWFDVDTS